MKKILLINPPYPFEEHPSPPFGLMSLAAYLLENGYDVRIEDYIIEDCTTERFSSVIQHFNPDVIGATAVSMTVKKSLSILSEYRKIAPDKIFVMGGAHVSFDSEAILNSGFIDFIVRGEGEITFTELLDSLNNKKDISSVKGISYISDGAVLHTPDRELIEDINILPYPAIHLASLSRYKAMDLPINMITSRGCPHLCIFCLGRRMVGSRLRYYTPERVVDEFEILAGLGFNQINIGDDLFTSNKKRCTAICDEIISRGIKHAWTAFARVDTVSEKLLLKLKEAGCTTLCFGIESGNQEILDRVKKRTTLDSCIKAAELCRKTGITPLASYILGLPGETEETLAETLRFARDLNMDFGIHILAPFPGTEVREKAADYGITVLTDDWDLYDANRSVCSTGTISTEKIDNTVQGFYASLEEYVEKCAIKKEKGEPVSGKDDFILHRRDIFNFNMGLIRSKLIENYRGLDTFSEEDLLNNFCSYISENTGKTTSFARDEINRLLAKGSIGIVPKDGGLTVSWM